MQLAIITTHPIQYNAPFFALLAKEPLLQVKVFYTWPQSVQQKKFDPGFGKIIDWDIPLLEGYDYSFSENTSSSPGSHHFKGIVNPSLVSEIENWGADALLVYGWAFKSHLQCLRYFHKKKLVLFRGDSTLLDEKKGIKTLLRRIFLKWVYRHVDYALYAGENNKQYFLVHGLKAGQLLYAPHAIDNTRFEDTRNRYKDKALQMREAIGIKPEDLVLLFAGKFETKKNPFFVIQLMQNLPHKNLKVLFVGNGKLEQALKTAAADDDRIKFLDFQNQLQMPVVYRTGNIFILPSAGPGETWGLALNEAMACGLPVASSFAAGGAIDLVDDGVNGILFDKYDVKKVTAFVEQALLNRQMLATMGARSLEKINSFRFENIVQPVLELAKNVNRLAVS